MESISKKKIYTFFICVAILVCIAITAIYYPYVKSTQVVTYKYGSKGDIVTQIQTKLKRWGYYNGTINGKYDYDTVEAVKKFQTKNKLKQDGVAGDNTLKAMGIYVKSTTATNTNTTNKTTENSDLMLLAKVINGEARGEPYEGQVAVGAVILNRTRNPEFPSTIAGVIYQPGAFTAIVDGQINAKLEPNSIKAAKDALNGWDPSGGAIYYYNPAKTTNKWIWSRPVIKVIGHHKFCK